VRKRENILVFWLLIFFHVVAIAQQAEYNMGSNWVYPTAQKYVGLDFINAPAGSVVNNGTTSYGKNFTNNGNVGFVNTLVTNPALTQFTGTAQQRISGSGSTRFYSLQFINQLIAGAYSLEQNILVAHEADFTKGIVTALQTTPETAMNMVQFEIGATSINASDNSFVDGFVSKLGNNTFTFPIGNGGFYRPAGISAPANATDAFVARYIYSNPDNAGYSRSQKTSTITQISNKEYWVINQTSGSSLGQVTLSWDVTKTSATVPSMLKGLSIARWDGTTWIDEGNLLTTGDETTGTITANVTGYGVFTLAQTNFVLPEFTKSSTKPIKNNDGTFSWSYTLSLFNNTPYAIDSIQVKDNLDDVFKNKNCTYTITRIIATGNLKSNGLYNGSSDVNTLLSGSSMATGRLDSIKIEVKVDTHSQTDSIEVSNQATLSGTMGSTKVSLLSDDKTVSGTQDPTKTTIQSLTLFIPDAFSPNGDGINDKLEIVHDWNSKIDIEVFNRDGILVYKSSDYQNDWAGYGTNGWLGHKLEDGTYFISFKLINKSSGEVVTKGVRYVTLRR